MSVAVFEEHSTIGLPEHCAGLISVSGLRRLNINIPRECILNRVNSAIFYSPSGTCFSVSRKKPQAYVFNRPLLDQYLASEAQKENVELFRNSKVLAVKMGEKRSLKIFHRKETVFETKVIIDAEGIRGKFVRNVGLTPVSKGVIPGVQFEVNNVEVNPHQVEMFFGNKVAPGFFAWIIPTGENTARVGVGARRQALQYLKKFIKNHPIASKRLSKAIIVKKFGGAITLSGPIPRTYTDGFLVIGDAAGQVKPTTGGGVIMGGLCAQIAGEVAAKAVIDNNVDSKSLAIYQKKCRRLLSREFSSMLLVRRILNRMSDNNLDKLFNILIKNDFTRDIEEIGDMDFESAVIRKLILKPKLSAQIIFNFLTSILIGIREQIKEKT